MIVKGTSKEKRICMSILAIHKAMDFIDDGYHNKQIRDLVLVSNKLFEELSPTVQEALKSYFDTKALEKDE